MSSARPSMHADLYYTWLWCTDNAKVTQWSMNEPNRHAYRLFYSSFINACNRVWDMSMDKNAVLQKPDQHMLACLLKEEISADMMIKALNDYNYFLGGTHGQLKRKGLIKFEHGVTPELSVIEAAVNELKNKISATRKKVVARFPALDSGDLEMEDIDDSHRATAQHNFPSLGSLDDGLNAAAKTTPGKKIDNNKNFVKFGKLPLIGGKKKQVGDDEDDDDMGIK